MKVIQVEKVRVDFIASIKEEGTKVLEAIRSTRQEIIAPSQKVEIEVATGDPMLIFLNLLSRNDKYGKLCISPLVSKVINSSMRRH